MTHLFADTHWPTQSLAHSLRFIILCHFAVFSWEVTGSSPRLLVLHASSGNPPTILLVVRHRYTIQFFRSWKGNKISSVTTKKDLKQGCVWVRIIV